MTIAPAAGGDLARERTAIAAIAANEQSAHVWRLLVVDDDAVSLTLIARLVERMGHVVRKADGGATAMAVIDEGWPDIVLTDLYMPGADGCAVARHAKTSARHWLPVVMLTGISQDDQMLVNALEAGADDYLVKPVSFPVLRAKLGALARTLQLQRETARQHDELKGYRAVEDDNNRMAEHLIQKFSARASIADAAVSHWVRAAERFSGDMVMAARTPTGALHAMLADATGHGLPAAISLLPLLKTFQTMTVKGYGIGEIARELNSTAREHLPVGRFIAATLLAVDARYRRVQVWNGANPALHLVADNGTLLFSAHSRHLALGIAGNPVFSGAVEQFEYDCPCQAVACSDGVLEVRTRSGEPLGDGGWLSLLCSRDPRARMPALCQMLDMPMPAGGYEDDASAVFVDCSLEPVDSLPLPRPGDGLARQHAPGQWRMTLALSQSELKRLDPVPMLLGFINQMEGVKPHAANLFLILSELFNNALDHGLLGLDSSIKHGMGGFERWILTRETRLRELETGSIELHMSVRQEGPRQVLIIGVKDSGPGFDRVKLDAAQADNAVHGRGVALVKRLCRSVEYWDSGNNVSAHYDLGEAAAHPMLQAALERDWVVEVKNH